MSVPMPSRRAIAGRLAVLQRLASYLPLTPECQFEDGKCVERTRLGELAHIAIDMASRDPSERNQRAKVYAVRKLAGHACSPVAVPQDGADVNSHA